MAEQDSCSEPRYYEMLHPTVYPENGKIKREYFNIERLICYSPKRNDDRLYKCALREVLNKNGKRTLNGEDFQWHDEKIHRIHFHVPMSTEMDFAWTEYDALGEKERWYCILMSIPHPYYDREKMLLIVTPMKTLEDFKKEFGEDEWSD